MEVITDLIILTAFLAGDWMVVKKSGRNPWNLLIPVYNILLHLDIAGLRRRWLIYATVASFAFAFLFGSDWYKKLGLTGEDVASLWITLLLIPLCIKIARKFGRSSKFGTGMAVLPFVFAPILGFGRSEYQGEKPLEPESFKFPAITKRRVAVVLSSLLLLFGIGVYTAETYEECVARVKRERNLYRSTAKGAGVAGAAGYAASTAGLTGSAMGIGSVGIAGGALATGLGWAIVALPFVALLGWADEYSEIQKQCGDKK